MSARHPESNGVPQPAPGANPGPVGPDGLTDFERDLIAWFCQRLGIPLRLHGRLAYRPPPDLPFSPPLEQLVTLDQAAAMVRRSKRTLERYKKRMPPPRAVGRGGKASYWAWPELRPWLEKEFGFRLPESFPGR